MAYPKHHVKRGYRKALIFVAIVVAVFSVSMLFTNLKDEQGNVDLSKSKILTKIGDELGTLSPENLLKIGKGTGGDTNLLYEPGLLHSSGLLPGVDEPKQEQEKQKTEKDTDNDGLADSLEQSLGTNPNNADSDGDGLTDGDEYAVVNSDPLKKDSDEDGLSDGEEVLEKSTEPTISDSDGDGVDDNIEIVAGTDPNDQSAKPTKAQIKKAQKEIETDKKAEEAKSKEGADKEKTKAKTSAKPKYTQEELTQAEQKITDYGNQNGKTLYSPGGYKFVSNGDGTWKRYHQSGEMLHDMGALTTEQMKDYLKQPNCANGLCLFEENGKSVYGKDVPPKYVEQATGKAPQLEAQTEAQGTQQPPQPFTAGYNNFDPEGDLIVNLNQGENIVGQYFFRDKGLFGDEIYKINQKTGKKELCKGCEIFEEEGKWFLKDNTLSEKEGFGKVEVGADPDDEQERILNECESHAKMGHEMPECQNANVLFGKVMDNLDFEFRSRVEVVFGTLFDKWSEGWLGSRLEYYLYSNVCHVQYYRGDDTDQDLIAGGSVEVPSFYYDWDQGAGKLFVVNIAGEKEQLTNTIYRYGFSVKLIGQMHYVIYLYNSCTKEKSFSTGLATEQGVSSPSTPQGFSWKEYFTGAGQQQATTTQKAYITGWRDEGILGYKGVHQAHYAGDNMLFDCAENPTAGNTEKKTCRFNQACVKVLDDEEHVEPYCVELTNGPGFFTLGEETGSVEC
ncbi:hypothetical protein HY636_02430 [Candidatus Woesearchaeota archaeon]|nr:hypothetical protein [Candidatus Woesearchaeota archaeon]